MDFLGDLLDLGDRKHRRGGHHGHDDDYDDENFDRQASHRGYDDPAVVGTQIPCVKCSTPLQQSFNFCPNCGTPVPRVKKCASCGGEVAPSAKFCPSCGTKAP